MSKSHESGEVWPRNKYSYEELVGVCQDVVRVGLFLSVISIIIQTSLYSGYLESETSDRVLVSIVGWEGVTILVLLSLWVVGRGLLWTAQAKPELSAFAMGCLGIALGINAHIVGIRTDQFLRDQLVTWYGGSAPEWYVLVWTGLDPIGFVVTLGIGVVLGYVVVTKPLVGLIN